MKTWRRDTLRWRVILLALAVFAGGALLAPAGAASSGLRLYVPIARNAAATTTPTPPPGGSTAPAPFFLPFNVNGNVYNTETPHMAVDPHGGVHALYSTFVAYSTNARLPVIYSYCPSDCGKAANFHAVLLGGTSDKDDIYDAMLALDPAGHPRLLLSTLDNAVYATCDANCTSAASWHMTTLAAPGEFGVSFTASGFALDPLGRPGFVSSQSGYAFGGAKTWYNGCDAQCDNPANWHSLQIATAQLGHPQLAFTHDGRPRLAFGLDGTDAYIVAFAACESACATNGAWSAVGLAPTNANSGSFVLRIDAHDQPHMAIYTDAITDGAFKSNQLYYFWCATNCVNSQSLGWEYYDTGFAENRAVDLALAPGGRVWLAFGTKDGLSAATCATACETGSAQWQQSVVDTNQELNDTQKPNPVPGCAMGFWSLGNDVSLGLDPSGAPRVTYSARHLVLCSGHVETDIEWARFSLIPPAQ